MFKETIDTFKGIERLEDNAYACGHRIPDLSIKEYLIRLNKYIPITWEHNIAMLIYIDRYLALNNRKNDFLNPYNVHRLLLTSLAILLTPLNKTWINERIAKTGGVSQTELETMVAIFISFDGFSTGYTSETYMEYENVVNGLTQDQKIAFLMGSNQKLGKDKTLPHHHSLFKSKIYDKNLLQCIFDCVDPNQEKNNSDEEQKPTL